METDRVAGLFERVVTSLQIVIAALLVFVLLLGVIVLAIEVGGTLLTEDRFELTTMLALLNMTIDVILYLFIVIELYKTVIAYVDARSVVLAVVHAGLIAVVRQIITFKPTEYGPGESIQIAGVYAILLAVLLLGFVIVHKEEDIEGEE